MSVFSQVAKYTIVIWLVLFSDFVYSSNNINPQDSIFRVYFQVKFIGFSNSLLYMGNEFDV